MAIKCKDLHKLTRSTNKHERMTHTIPIKETANKKKSANIECVKLLLHENEPIGLDV